MITQAFLHTQFLHTSPLGALNRHTQDTLSLVDDKIRGRHGNWAFSRHVATEGRERQKKKKKKLQETKNVDLDQV